MNNKRMKLVKQLSISAAVLAGLMLSAPVVGGQSMAAVTTPQTTATNDAAHGSYTDSDTNSSYHFDWSLSNDGTLTLSNASFVFGGSHTPGYNPIAQQLGGAQQNVKHVIISGKAMASGSIQRLFSEFPNVESIDASNIDVTGVTSFQAVFYSDPKLSSVNITGWNTAKPTNTHSMFEGSPVTSVSGLNDLNTSEVTDMGTMFHTDSVLASTDQQQQVNNLIQGFINSHPDVSKVTDFDSIFKNPNLTNLDLSAWKMGNGNSDYSTTTFMGDTHSTVSTVTFGPSTNFKDTESIYGASRSDAAVVVNLAGGNQIKLPVDGSGKWQAVGSGSVLYPQGATYAKNDLANMYVLNAPNHGAKETYVWAHKDPNINLSVNKTVTLKSGQKFDPALGFASITDGGRSPTDEYRN